MTHIGFGEGFGDILPCMYFAECVISLTPPSFAHLHYAQVSGFDTQISPHFYINPQDHKMCVNFPISYPYVDEKDRAKNPGSMNFGRTNAW